MPAFVAVVDCANGYFISGEKHFRKFYRPRPSEKLAPSVQVEVVVDMAQQFRFYITWPIWKRKFQLVVGQKLDT